VCAVGKKHIELKLSNSNLWLIIDLYILCVMSITGEPKAKRIWKSNSISSHISVVSFAAGESWLKRFARIKVCTHQSGVNVKKHYQVVTHIFIEFILKYRRAADAMPEDDRTQKVAQCIFRRGRNCMRDHVCFQYCLMRSSVPHDIWLKFSPQKFSFETPNLDG
jgi:hypothetical protein